MKTVISKYGLESVKIEKSLNFSDFILIGYGWLRLFLSRYFPMQNRLKIVCKTWSEVISLPEISFK